MRANQQQPARPEKPARGIWASSHELNQRRLMAVCRRRQWSQNGNFCHFVFFVFFFLIDLSGVPVFLWFCLVRTCILCFDPTGTWNRWDLVSEWDTFLSFSRSLSLFLFCFMCVCVCVCFLILCFWLIRERWSMSRFERESERETEAER